MSDISFRIIEQGREVSFDGKDLSSEDKSVVCKAFADAVVSNMAHPAPFELDALEGFFPEALDADDKEEEDHPENEHYMETGIKQKMRGGVWIPTYRVRYSCTNSSCGKSGTHYVPQGTAKVSCHHCSARMEIREATSIGFPNRDSYGNFYVAGNPI